MSVAIDHILDEVSNYPLSDKELIVDILQRRLVEEKREAILREYREAMEDFNAGRVKSGSVDDLFDAIND